MQKRRRMAFKRNAIVALISHRQQVQTPLRHIRPGGRVILKIAIFTLQKYLIGDLLVGGTDLSACKAVSSVKKLSA